MITQNFLVAIVLKFVLMVPHLMLQTTIVHATILAQHATLMHQLTLFYVSNVNSLETLYLVTNAWNLNFVLSLTMEIRSPCPAV